MIKHEQVEMSEKDCEEVQQLLETAFKAVNDLNVPLNLVQRVALAANFCMASLDKKTLEEHLPKEIRVDNIRKSMIHALLTAWEIDPMQFAIECGQHQCDA